MELRLIEDKGYHIGMLCKLSLSQAKMNIAQQSRSAIFSRLNRWQRRLHCCLSQSQSLRWSSMTGAEKVRMRFNGLTQRGRYVLAKTKLLTAEYMRSITEEQRLFLLTEKRADLKVLPSVKSVETSGMQQIRANIRKYRSFKADQSAINLVKNSGRRW